LKETDREKKREERNEDRHSTSQLCTPPTCKFFIFENESVTFSRYLAYKILLSVFCYYSFSVVLHAGLSLYSELN